MKQFDYCVFIGRLQPFHMAHYKLIQEALNQANRVVVIIGSAKTAPNPKNPWTVEEREQMVRKSFSLVDNARIICIHMRDYLYNDNLWLADLQQKVSVATDNSENIGLIGCAYDNSSFYLALFPQWKKILMKNMDQFPHATSLREMYFSGDKTYEKFVTPQTVELLNEFSNSDKYKSLQQDYEYVKKYVKAWEKAPFPPTFTTVDAVVIKSGHVLVVRRKGFPGKGLIALPGGFLAQNEKIQDGMLRELKEETVIKVDKEELEKAICGKEVFDHPNRSLRGRTITHAFLINLKSGPLPKVKGSDDAEKAFWMPLSEVFTKEIEFFEDHFHIISFFCYKY